MSLSTQYYILMNDPQAAGTAVPSVMSDALRRVSERATDDQETALLEKAIKEASASAYAGS